MQSYVNDHGESENDICFLNSATVTSLFDIIWADFTLKFRRSSRKWPVLPKGHFIFAIFGSNVGWHMGNNR